jgi:SAM-dependent methyltransferase
LQEVDYDKSAASAPPGWRHFSVADIERLPSSVREHEMARVPAADRQGLIEGDTAAQEKVMRAFFWTLLYHLEPAKWDELSRSEPIHPGLLAALPASAGRALDVGAGSGRLTGHLAKRCQTVIAIEPAVGLGKLLRKRLPGVSVVAGWAESLPVRDGWSNLTTACGVVGPDAAVLRELARVTASGGAIVLLSPEAPEWFESNGWRRLELERVAAPPHAPWIDEFFGPPDPPHQLVSRLIA